MCALGTKRRVLVHKKFPNRARFGLSPHLKHGMHLEGALTHLDYKRSRGRRTVSIKPIRKLVWDWSPVAPSDPLGDLGGILAKLGGGGPVQWTCGVPKTD